MNSLYAQRNQHSPFAYVSQRLHSNFSALDVRTIASLENHRDHLGGTRQSSSSPKTWSRAPHSCGRCSSVSRVLLFCTNSRWCTACRDRMYFPRALLSNVSLTLSQPQLEVTWRMYQWRTAKCTLAVHYLHGTERRLGQSIGPPSSVSISKVGTSLV